MNGFTALAAAAQYAVPTFQSLAVYMGINFEATFTEADFKRPLLDAAEEQLARELRGDSDLAVEGLRHSLLSWFVGLFVGRGGRAS